MDQQIEELLTKEAEAREVLEGRVAKLENSAQLSEDSSKEVAELRQKLSRAEAKTMDDFRATEKANFVIGWARSISPEDKAVFAKAVGIPIAEAEVAEGDQIIEGKTDKEGYRYLETLDLSVKEESA